MQRTHIEFGQAISSERRLAHVSLSMLVAIGAFGLFYYWKTTQAVTSLSALLVQDDGKPPNRASAPVTDARQDEIQRSKLRAARSVIDRLRTPWPSLFLALENSTKAEVVILRIEPDAGHQEVRITANASKISGAVAYATSLRNTGVLARVYVANQRESATDPLHPVQVVVVGQWATKDPQSGDHANQASNGVAKW
jgi:hypothetical protein